MCKYKAFGFTSLFSLHIERPSYEHNLLNEKSVIDRHRCHMAAKFAVLVVEDHTKLPTSYWLPTIHKKPKRHVLLLTLAHALQRFVDIFYFLSYCD